MKKILVVLSVILSLVLLFAFASCDDNGSQGESQSESESAKEPQSAQDVMDRIGQEMEKLNSYEIKLRMNMTFYIMGKEVHGSAVGRNVEYGIGGEDYYYYDYMVINTTCDELDLEESQTSIEAYNEGKLFIANKDSSIDQKLCTQMTVAEFLEYKEEKDSDNDVDLEDCTSINFSKKEDNTWEISYSGYTKRAITAFLKETGLDEEMLGADILDMKISVTAGEDFRAKLISVEFIFDAEDETTTPSITYTAEYENYDSANKVTSTIKAEDYTEIEDIKILDELADMIEALQSDKDGSLVLDVDQTTSLAGNKSTSSETDTISYGEKNGGYFYDITAEADSTTIYVSYENGVQTIKQGTQSQNNSQSEDDARAYINNLINVGKYDKKYVSDAKRLSDGVYEIKSDEPEASAYEQAFASMGASYKSASQTTVYTIEDGKIVKIENEITALGTVASGYSTYTISITTNSVVTFE